MKRTSTEIRIMDKSHVTARNSKKIMKINMMTNIEILTGSSRCSGVLYLSISNMDELISLG